MIYFFIVGIMVALCTLVIVRRAVKGGGRDADITVALASLVVALFLSLPSIHNPLDRTLWGIGLINCIGHLLICLCGWLMGRGLYGPLSSSAPGWRQGRTGLGIGVAGTIGTWVISAAVFGQPRVVHDATMTGFYWSFTLITFVWLLVSSITAPGKVLKYSSRYRDVGRFGMGRAIATYIIAAIAYVDIAVGLVVLWIVEFAPLNPLVVTREVMVYSGPFLLLLALLACPLSSRFGDLSATPKR